MILIFQAKWCVLPQRTLLILASVRGIQVIIQNINPSKYIRFWTTEFSLWGFLLHFLDLLLCIQLLFFSAWKVNLNVQKCKHNFYQRATSSCFEKNRFFNLKFLINALCFFLVDVWRRWIHHGVLAGIEPQSSWGWDESYKLYNVKLCYIWILFVFVSPHSSKNLFQIMGLCLSSSATCCFLNWY